MNKPLLYSICLLVQESAKKVHKIPYQSTIFQDQINARKVNQLFRFSTSHIFKMILRIRI